MFQRTIAFLLACGPLSTTWGQNQVWTIDDNGPADFHQLQRAIEHADQGDTLLVSGGSYSGFQVDNKALQIVARTGEVVIVAGGFGIHNLEADRSVLVNGDWSAQFVQVIECAGHVAFDGLKVFPPVSFPGGNPGNLFEYSDDVVLVNCELRGQRGTDSQFVGNPGAPGLRVGASRVSIYSSLFVGGIGGVGVGGFSCAQMVGGPGGSGLLVLQQSSLRYHNSTLLGGYGGRGCIYDGADGARLEALPGTSVERGVDPELLLTAPSYVIDGAQTRVRVSGRPGFAVFLHLGSEPALRRLPIQVGSLHVAGPFLLQPIGTIPGAGALQTDLQFSGPLMGREFSLHRIQALGLHGGRRVLSNPVATMVVDQ